MKRVVWILKGLAICGALVLGGDGCATYFRSGEMSPQEINQRNRERYEEEHRFFEPKEHFGP
ncbi:MAG: hypothetical protein EPO07_15930 [Verrucomicrobia bacterium]|nr:MAG: hypothetical protein EPO07_15930 [Verrucomicrobiota bacterium]